MYQTYLLFKYCIICINYADWLHQGTGGSAFGPPFLSTSHVDVLALTVSLYIIKCERRLEMASFFSCGPIKMKMA